MIELATITAITGLVKSGRDAIRALRDAKIADANRPHVVALEDALNEIGDRLFGLREEALKLQEENARLRAELASAEHIQKRKAAYKLIKTPVGGMVYEFTGEPSHYACPSCFEKDTISVLQDVGRYSGSHACRACKAHFATHEAETMEVGRASTEYF